MNCFSKLEIVGGKVPRITEHPSDVTVARNDPVTLQCAGDGVPPPQIEWYHDGELILANTGVGGVGGDDKVHRILLPGGALFFLRASHSRKENDAGVYWCVARNAAGLARSANATLTVARKFTPFYYSFTPYLLSLIPIGRYTYYKSRVVVDILTIKVDFSSIYLLVK